MLGQNKKKDSSSDVRHPSFARWHACTANADIHRNHSSQPCTTQHKPVRFLIFHVCVFAAAVELGRCGGCYSTGSELDAVGKWPGLGLACRIKGAHSVYKRPSQHIFFHACLHPPLPPPHPHGSPRVPLVCDSQRTPKSV